MSSQAISSSIPTQPLSWESVANRTLFFGAATGIAAKLFTSIHPVGGFLFGATSALSYTITHALSNAAFNSGLFEQNDTAIKVVKFVSGLFPTIAAIAVTSMAGFPLSFGSVMVLTVVPIGVGFLCAIGVGFLGISAGLLCIKAFGTEEDWKEAISALES